LRRSLEERLKDSRGPDMPPEVEARILRRIAAEQPKPTDSTLGPVKRTFLRASAGQLALLVVLLILAGLVVRHRIVPTLQALWERAHCLVYPGAGKVGSRPAEGGTVTHGRP
jgi:hypothetical protein